MGMRTVRKNKVLQLQWPMSQKNLFGSQFSIVSSQ